jgi:hypothetical protein
LLLLRRAQELATPLAWELPKALPKEQRKELPKGLAMEVVMATQCALAKHPSS